MRYRMNVAAKDTARESTYEVDADDPQSAASMANAMGYLVCGAPAEASSPKESPPERDKRIMQSWSETRSRNRLLLVAILLATGVVLYSCIVLPIQWMSGKVHDALRSDFEIEVDKIAAEQHVNHDQAMSIARKAAAERERTHPHLEIGKRYVLAGQYAASKSDESFDRWDHIRNEGDKAASRSLWESGELFSLREGTDVYLEDISYSHDRAKIRVAGTTDLVWVDIDALRLKDN
jgi:hypothetical protein